MPDRDSTTIHDSDEKGKAKLRFQVARQSLSMEDTARNVLRTAQSTASSQVGGLAEAIRARFDPFGGIELEIPSREPEHEPLDFEE